MTDPTRYCKDIEGYEQALALGVDEMLRLLNEGYVTQKAAGELFSNLCDGLYGESAGQK